MYQLLKYLRQVIVKQKESDMDKIYFEKGSDRFRFWTVKWTLDIYRGRYWHTSKYAWNFYVFPTIEISKNEWFYSLKVLWLKLRLIAELSID